MARILDRAIAEFKSARAETKCEIVPEWGDAKVYWRPMWSLGERAAVIGNIENRIEFMLDVLMVKAIDENGDLLFKPFERVELANEVRPEIIQRLAALMLAGLNGPPAAVAEKN